MLLKGEAAFAWQGTRAQLETEVSCESNLKRGPGGHGLLGRRKGMFLEELQACSRPRLTCAAKSEGRAASTPCCWPFKGPRLPPSPTQ